METLKKTISFIIILFLVVLFCYAVLNKMFDFGNFGIQLEQSTGLEGYGEAVAATLLFLQVSAVVLLCYRPFQLWGLWMSFGIFAVFAGYIGIILSYSDVLPCTCIGLFENISWKGNLSLNIGLMITALVGIGSLKRARF